MYARYRYHHHHHVVLLARISLALSRHFSLSFIVSGKSSGLHPISSHSCCMYVRAGRPAFARPYVGVHRSTSLMSLSLLLQQCPTGDISTLDGTSLKLVDKFTYLGSSISSTEKDIDTRLTTAWTAIDRLSIIWKSDLTDKMKCSFFQAAVVLILQYGCTTRTLTKWLEKKLDGNYTRMLRAILNKSWRQHPTRHQLYGHLPPITKTIQVRPISKLYKHHHHIHVVLVARISLSLSRHFSLSFIASGRSSGQHPVSSHSCWMYIRAGRPAFARPCVGVHKSTLFKYINLYMHT